MKKHYDWLSPESRVATYCLKKITTFWEFTPFFAQKRKPTVQFYSLALLTTILLWENVPVFQNAQLPGSSSESCSEYTFLSSGSAQGTVSLPKFDPALGTLRSIEITTECTVMADVEQNNIQGNNYSLGLNIALTTGLPGREEKVLSYQSQFRRALKSNQNSSSFTADFTETKKSTELITDQLAAFTGKGDLSIPLKVEGLVNFKNETSRISSNLKTKLCIKYLYD